MKRLVIIPTYNEAENVGAMLDALLSLEPAVHVLIVDDNSPDGTAKVVEAHPELGKRVFLLKREKKEGLGTAYKAGFRWALERGYELICQMDCDFSHRPQDLPKLIKTVESGEADMAVGSRYVPGGRVENWPWKRVLLSRYANIYARLLTRCGVKDLTGGFTCSRREVIEGIDFESVKSEGYSFQIEIKCRAARRGFKIVEVPIVFVERERGTSKMSRKIIVEAFFTVLRLALGRGLR